MRFYVPEWDDCVDPGYDFSHDEYSVISRSERERAYIWDIFDHKTAPIDGVLISREQVQDTITKFDQLTSNGVYGDPDLQLPEWLPTISDCGAWGYKELPFPPYDVHEMLDFYEKLGVNTGVTIDHLVLGSGHTSRLYLNERGFSSDFTENDIPDALRKRVDLMVDEWPREWPKYVQEYEDSICQTGTVSPFQPEMFDGTIEDVLNRLQGDPRAVYRSDDTQFRYDLTLRNADQMLTFYQDGEYSFRLMVAIQGWNPDSYIEAAEQVLGLGYQYLGIGGVAGSRQEIVEEIVAAVGNRIATFEQANETRVDAHVFGFAKTGAFETIGQSGMTSFDSASMLRAAWLSGDNYHLFPDERYDAIRLRFPQSNHSLEQAIEISLRGRELHVALEAFDRGESIRDAIRAWHSRTEEAIGQLLDYLEAHRFDERFNGDRQTEVEAAFRAGYPHARILYGSFGRPFRKRIVKLLRADHRDDPLPWEEYLTVVASAINVFESTIPTPLTPNDPTRRNGQDHSSFDRLWALIEAYVSLDGIDDERLLPAYRQLLERQPWMDCDCPICSDLGIEVAIFRGNNRNRRRGFHNTRRFYDQFEEALPKLLVLTKADSRLVDEKTVEQYLRRYRPEFWAATHDLPVIELGVISGEGISEWWEPTPDSISFDASDMYSHIEEISVRYQDLFIDNRAWNFGDDVVRAAEQADCVVHQHWEVQQLRRAIEKRLQLTEQSKLTRY